MIKLYGYYAIAAVSGLLFITLLTPAIIGLMDLYVITFSDHTTGIIDWTDARGFRAFLFGLTSFLLWIPIALALDAADNERSRIVAAVTKRLST